MRIARNSTGPIVLPRVGAIDDRKIQTLAVKIIANASYVIC